MTKEAIRRFVNENVTYESLILDQGISEYEMANRISIGVSFETFEEYPYKRYIYNLFYDGEYININEFGTLEEPLSEEVLEELERTYNTLTQ